MVENSGMGKAKASDVGPRRVNGMAASGVAGFGVLLSLTATFAPMALRENAASRNIASVAKTIAGRVDAAFAAELDTMRAAADAVPDLVPVPDELEARLKDVRVPSDQALFTDVLLVSALGKASDGAPALALRLGHSSDGTGLIFAGMSAGTSVTDLLAASGLPRDSGLERRTEVPSRSRPRPSPRNGRPD